MGKAFRLDAEGRLAKRAAGEIVRAEATTIAAPDAAAFAAMLREASDHPDRALILGAFYRSPARDPFEVVTRKALRGMLPHLPDDRLAGVHDGPRGPVAARLAAGIGRSAFLPLDLDAFPGMPAAWRGMTLADACGFLDPIIPGLATCERVEARSSSARVVAPGGTPGPASHGFPLVSDPTLIPELHRRVRRAMVAHGLAVPMVKRSRSTGEAIGEEARTVFDLAVWHRGRLLFCAAPDVTEAPGFTVADAGVRIVNEGAGPLDLSWLREDRARPVCGCRLDPEPEAPPPPPPPPPLPPRLALARALGAMPRAVAERVQRDLGRFLDPRPARASTSARCEWTTAAAWEAGPAEAIAAPWATLDTPTEWRALAVLIPAMVPAEERIAALPEHARPWLIRGAEGADAMAVWPLAEPVARGDDASPGALRLAEHVGAMLAAALDGRPLGPGALIRNPLGDRAWLDPDARHLAAPADPAGDAPDPLAWRTTPGAAPALLHDLRRALAPGWEGVVAAADAAGYRRPMRPRRLVRINPASTMRDCDLFDASRFPAYDMAAAGRAVTVEALRPIADAHNAQFLRPLEPRDVAKIVRSIVGWVALHYRPRRGWRAPKPPADPEATKAKRAQGGRDAGARTRAANDVRVREAVEALRQEGAKITAAAVAIRAGCGEATAARRLRAWAKCTINPSVPYHCDRSSAPAAAPPRVPPAPPSPAAAARRPLRLDVLRRLPGSPLAARRSGPPVVEDWGEVDAWLAGAAAPPSPVAAAPPAGSPPIVVAPADPAAPSPPAVRPVEAGRPDVRAAFAAWLGLGSPAAAAGRLRGFPGGARSAHPADRARAPP